ncbi:TIGR02452 family protein [bacterium]|nr:TIGR02452 family protein [bacterium]
MANPKNISIFEDTVNLVENTKRLREAVAASLRSQKFIAENDSVPDGSHIERFETSAQIVVSKKRTFEAVSAYTGKGDRLCVLNFASATNPGGGVVNGSSAQEESLCRVSTLYFTLDTDENRERFYKPHKMSHDPIHNDDILYTPDIVVFKTDSATPERMPESAWFNCDVITCAAPNLRENPVNRYNNGDGRERLLLSDDELVSVHRKRDRRIFDVAVQNKVDVLVLGAFGCGAFRNSPTVVADVMLSLAKEYEHAFKTIEFAVYCPPFDDTNYRIFTERAKKL